VAPGATHLRSRAGRELYRAPAAAWIPPVWCQPGACRAGEAPVCRQRGETRSRFWILQHLLEPLQPLSRGRSGTAHGGGVLQRPTHDRVRDRRGVCQTGHHSGTSTLGSKFGRADGNAVERSHRERRLRSHGRDPGPHLHRHRPVSAIRAQERDLCDGRHLGAQLQASFGESGHLLEAPIVSPARLARSAIARSSIRRL